MVHIIDQIRELEQKEKSFSRLKTCLSNRVSVGPGNFINQLNNSSCISVAPEARSPRIGMKSWLSFY